MLSNNGQTNKQTNEHIFPLHEYAQLSQSYKNGQKEQKTYEKVSTGISL